MDKYLIANRILQESQVIKTNYKTSGPYWKYRALRPLLKLYNKAWRSYRKGVPWTSPASILIFDKILTGNMRGFEFGSGSSTMYFAKLLDELVSVEHDKEWYEKVKSKISSLQNVNYQLIPPDNKDSFANYSEYILRYPDQSFDFIIIDGRDRVRCSLNAIEKLKPGGVLVLDNSERPRYAKVFEILSTWKMVNTTTGLTDTTFWFKPNPVL